MMALSFCFIANTSAANCANDARHSVSTTAPPEGAAYVNTAMVLLAVAYVCVNADGLVEGATLKNPASVPRCAKSFAIASDPAAVIPSVVVPTSTLPVLQNLILSTGDPPSGATKITSLAPLPTSPFSSANAEIRAESNVKKLLPSCPRKANDPKENPLNDFVGRASVPPARCNKK